MKSQRKIPERETGRSCLRVGILGCSDIARRKFIPAMAQSSRVRLTAVSSRDSSLAEQFAVAFGCNRFSHDELLARPDIDLIYLSLPNQLHEEWTIRALAAGKHVICEKPLATSLAAATRMLAAAETHRRLLYENQMFLFHPQHGVVKALLDSGRIGRVRELRCCFGFPLPAAGNFRLDPSQGGGAFHDLARYPLGTAVHFLQGLPRQFRGHSRWQGRLNLAVHGTALTDADESFCFSIAFGQQYESLYELIGESGSIRLERAFTTPPDYANRILLRSGTETSAIPVAAADHFSLMIEAIAAAVQAADDFTPFIRRAGLIARLAAEMEAGCPGGVDD